YFKHLVFDSIDELCDSLDGMDFTKHNYYFCISSLQEESIEVGDRKRVRVQANTQKTRCFILDVDIRPDKPGHYGTVEEALDGIQKIVSSFRLPQPIIVNSGFGLHVYWPMAAGVDPKEWSKVAHRFKRAISVVAPEVVA